MLLMLDSSILVLKIPWRHGYRIVEFPIWVIKLHRPETIMWVNFFQVINLVLLKGIRGLTKESNLKNRKVWKVIEGLLDFLVTNLSSTFYFFWWVIEENIDEKICDIIITTNLWDLSLSKKSWLVDADKSGNDIDWK